MSAAVATREFPGARVSVVEAARVYYAPTFPERPDWRTPDTPINDRGQALQGLNSMVIQTDSGTTIVDPASFRPDETTLGGGSVLEPGPSLDASLAELDVDPTEVRRVVITHCHDDHLSGVLDEQG